MRRGRDWKYARLVLGKNATVDQWHCHFPDYDLPEISTVPFFVMNSLYDTYQIGNILQLGCNLSSEGNDGGSCNATQLQQLQDSVMTC